MLLFLISIHAPREGGDKRRRSFLVVCLYFNPRPPRGGRLPDMGGSTPPNIFQSTPPARGATSVMVISTGRLVTISIHAPREGGDSDWRYRGACTRYFNPRPPRGGRRIGPSRLNTIPSFQSTPPARGATAAVCDLYQNCGYFNPRPPRGGRLYRCHDHPPQIYFNPRPPRGGRLLQLPLGQWCVRFQSTPPARGATPVDRHPHKNYRHFNPRPPRGGRRGFHSYVG